VKLLVPQHSRKSLPLYPPHVFVGNALLQSGVKVIRLGDALGENTIELVEAIRPFRTGAQPQPNRRAATGRDLMQVKSAYLGAFPVRIHCLGFLVQNVFVKRVLEVAWRSIDPEQSLEIGFVIAKQQAIRVLEANAKLAELSMPGNDDSLTLILQ